MPDYILEVGASMQCPHGGAVTAMPAQTRVVASGRPLTLASSLLAVAGCPFQVPVGPATKPQPCVAVRWQKVSSRVQVMGQPVLLQPSPGSGQALCMSVEQVPQGPPLVAVMQQRVSAT